MPAQTLVQLFRAEEKRRRYRSSSFLLRVGLLILLLMVPFLSPSFKMIDLITNIIIFATLVASYDILLGYTGILSFGHALFFGIGGYCVGFLVGRYGSPSYFNLGLAFVVAVLISSTLAVFISFFTLRVKTIFFAMITLALSEVTLVLAIKLGDFTGGEDGINFSMPGIFAVSANLGKFLGLEITGRVLTFYFILLSCLVLFLVMLRFIHSPLGRVLQAIRDNPQRAEALGYKPFVFQTISLVFGCVAATITGGLFAMWVKYVNPESCLHITILLNVLLMLIIGGKGTLYGGIIGAAFLKTGQTFLPDLKNLATSLFPHAQLLNNLLERWLIIFGILFILVVFFFPKGVVGSVKEYLGRPKKEPFFTGPKETGK